MRKKLCIIPALILVFAISFRLSYNNINCFIFKNASCVKASSQKQRNTFSDALKVSFGDKHISFSQKKLSTKRKGCLQRLKISSLESITSLSLTVFFIHYLRSVDFIDIFNAPISFTNFISLSILKI